MSYNYALMKPTNVGDPNYYHRVVDCQWACPAHTNVPEYIRLIAQGRFTDAYLLNRESNVFPGILGRTCDRPCEPACRRTRVDGKPVAICRLKRVAADNRDEVKHLIPTAPAVKNGKKIGLIGAGPASLTVANDLVPLGYEVTILEKLPRPGGLMRINIPAFRLPEQVLDEEIGYIVDMGVEVRYNSPVEQPEGAARQRRVRRGVCRQRRAQGQGARHSRAGTTPIRSSSASSGWSRFTSVTCESVGKRVLIIGVGNTAMDCCRSSKRLGATDVKVIARKTRKYFKASPWELEDAEEEGVEIIENLQPVRFIIENGVLTGMEFDKFRSVETAKGLQQEIIGREILPCDTVVLAIGQDNAFPFIEREIGLEFGKWDMPVVDKTTFMSTRPGVFFGGDAAFGPANIIWAVEHGHQAAISIHNYCQGVPLTERPAPGMTLASTKMGLHEWAYSNNYNSAQRQKMAHVDLPVRFASMSTEVEKGFTAEQTRAEVERCLNCDMETHFIDSLCIECDACIDICPVDCLTITPNADEPDLRTRFAAPAENLDQPLFVSGQLKQTGRVMIKDENVCLHCGLCAERCPTYAWDMRKFMLQIPYAGATVIPLTAV